MPFKCCTQYINKILESPLDSKEMKSVNPKGNQPRIFIGRPDAVAPILWPPDAKRWQEYIEELYDPDNQDGVATHLELDILECEVKWALGNITTNKASGGDWIPVELF